MSKKYPGENNLLIIFQLIEDKINYLKNTFQDSSKRVTSLSSSSTNEQYPTAKAVYDFVGGKKVVYSSTAPTVNDTSIVTIVL